MLSRFLFIQKRWKHGKNHWSVLKNKNTTKDKALDSFDDFYGSVFGNRWKNIRVALLSQHKYIALVNVFGDTEKTCKEMELEGAINVKSLVNLAKSRLEVQDKGAFAKDNVYKLDNKVDEIIKRQETKERFSIYPESAETQVPEKISFRNDTSVDETQNEENKLSLKDEIEKFKRPLEEVIEEDYAIDNSRMVDLSQSGALHDFVPATNIKGMEDWIPESDHYKYYSTTTDFPLDIQMEKEFSFPEHISLYTYEKGNCSDFPSPRKCQTGVQSHFLMDGSSILPPLLLGIEKGDKVLDACAAPGGKSLIMLQTLYPQILICNDIQLSRVNRIRSIMDQFVFNFSEKWEGKTCLITKSDARSIQDYEMYDKILVDVPCTTDRHSVMVDDNNIFKSTRIKERLKIPELQSAILANCLRLLRPGGSLVYSTCSLSPIQNDGVVHMALQKIFTDHGITATIKDLSLIIRSFDDIFKFENPKSLKYGQLVLPYLPANFGPMYVCKISRNED